MDEKRKPVGFQVNVGASQYQPPSPEETRKAVGEHMARAYENPCCETWRDTGMGARHGEGCEVTKNARKLGIAIDTTPAHPETFDQKLRREDREQVARAEAGHCVWSEHTWAKGTSECCDPTEPGYGYCPNHLRMHVRQDGDKEEARLVAWRAELEAQEAAARERKEGPGQREQILMELERQAAAAQPPNPERSDQQRKSGIEGLKGRTSFYGRLAWHISGWGNADPRTTGSGTK